MSLAADVDLGGFVWGLLLEWKKFVGPIKVGLSTQMKSRGSILGLVLELLGHQSSHIKKLRYAYSYSYDGLYCHRQLEIMIYEN
jgi:hypothetical protein